MTGADKENTDAWARKLKLNYPYAYDYRFSLAGPFNVNVLPVAILVDPSGTVVYHGPAQKLSESTIRKHLKGAVTRALYAWPEFAETAKSYFLDGEEGMALAALEVLVDEKQPGAKELLGQLNAIIAAKVRGVAESQASGDYLAAKEEGERLLECLMGRPWEEELAKRLEEIEHSDQAKKVMAGQLALREIQTARRVTTRKEGLAVIAELTALMKSQAGSVAARQAQMYRGLLRRIIAKMK